MEEKQKQKYCIERAANNSSLEVVTTWVKHANGRLYKEQQTREISRQPIILKKHKKHKKDKNTSSKEERLPPFLAQRKETAASLTKGARSCPVAWTAKVTSEQFNPIIWSRAYIAELLASRQSQAPGLPVGELEARLQHFLNVMEITLQTSTKGDYLGDSWKVGRL